MAKMPTDAKLITNPSSGAPGFYVENVPIILLQIYTILLSCVILIQPITTNHLL